MGAKKMNNIKDFEAHIADSLRESVDWGNIYIPEKISHTDVIGVALQKQHNHICQSSHPHFAADLNVAALMQSNLDVFTANPIASILYPDFVSMKVDKENTIYESEFSKARQKAGILNGIESILRKKSVSSSIIADVVIIADELCTNAVYNAPFVDLENTLPGASRDNQDVQMHDGRCAKVFLGTDGHRLVIGCFDLYGSLNLEKLFKRIKKCYDRGVAESMNMSGGGAGIGSFMVYNAAASYFAVVEEKRKTMICCALPVKMSNRARLELPKNMHFVIKK